MTIGGEIIRGGKLQNLEQHEWVTVRDLNVLVTSYLALHRRDVICVPVHQALSDLRLLVDLWQRDFTFDPALSLYVLLYFFLPHDVPSQMLRHHGQARLISGSCAAHIVLEVLLFYEITSQ